MVGQRIEMTVLHRDGHEVPLEVVVWAHEEGGGFSAFVRAGFLSAVRDSESHWLERPIVPNALRQGVDLFAPALEALPR